MSIATELKTDFDEVLKYGDLIRLKYFNISYGAGSYYDDDISLTQSGTDLWTSGLIQPVTSKQGSTDALLLQQGKILIGDKKVYVNGETQTSGLGPIKIGLGSPPQEYHILEDGNVTQWDINGSPIYKKVYCRYLVNGSFVGE